ncbi:Aromatic amino acid exporter YddG [Aquimixticola soesokkakensis]|uniref:Aromatic amino acid exporter YddG n=1 Tax=Aquimixticola soesokkakensis TaxID=1519096 RepID=A0A1Y5STY7_9RHOB|nr:EamA family transporter [Aquimixticola soesokkakensis]SLN48471.1 Aromatic amino acid exporter YddG [Aquimixticola soesokkakensis]
MTRRAATLTGLIAILLWALLGVFTVATAPVSPLQLNAVCLGIGALIGFGWIAAKGTWAKLRDVPIWVYAFGTAGIFGYHFLYFTALRLAPPAQAGLICYLWPLLIVLFSGLLPGERVRAVHLIGAGLAFAGVALILLDRGADFDPAAGAGYAVALVAALFWSGYSVGSRRLGDTPTEAVAIFCAASAILALAAHLALEQTLWPSRPTGWLAILGLGIGPVGAAFYVWDIGVKKGDIQLLGTASYAAPLLSTVALVVTGAAMARPSLFVAAALITAGALFAAQGSRRVTQKA